MPSKWQQLMKYIFASYLLLFSVRSFSQETPTEISGVVTFVTAQSVYVKFDATEQIVVGDTLHLKILNDFVPCLLVRNKSSVSVVCTLLNNCPVKKEDAVLCRPGLIPANLVGDDFSEEPENEDEIVKNERIHGRVSAASFSNLSDHTAPSHRTMYRLSMNADRIGESKFSVETFLNYRQLYLDPEKSSTQKTRFFNIYNLAVRYDVDSTFSLTVGRKINNKASSLGAIDGLQVEKYFGRIYTGVIAGYRPDFMNYSLNTDLLEFGGYVGLQTVSLRSNSKTTMGLLQQNNAGAVDRRYMYFQHSSSIRRNLNLFTSAELDLFSMVNGEAMNHYRLTNFYTSANYRISKAMDVNLSYDSRKQIMYYETYSSDIERMLEDDDARQGIRARAGLRPTKYTSLGVSYGKRFQSSNQNKSENINGYITYTKVPGIGGRISLNYNRNRSNYLLSEIIAIRLSQDLFKKNINSEIYFRKVNYRYFNEELTTPTTMQQYYYGISLLYRISPSWSFSMLGEMSTRDAINNYRMNLRLNKRFDTKKKKKKVEPRPNKF
jgi:hypothetical protein